MKKLAALMLLAAAVSSPLFSASFSIANLATGSLREYDMPLIQAITYFAGAFFSFTTGWS